MARKITILLIEDEESDVIIIKRAIAEIDPDVDIVIAANGEEALALLRHEKKYVSAPKIDIMFLDLNMSRMNGFEFLQEAKTHPDIKHIPVVVMTSSNRDKDVDNAYQLGANSYVTKPMDVDEFTKTLNSVINYWKNICRLPS